MIEKDNLPIPPLAKYQPTGNTVWCTLILWSKKIKQDLNNENFASWKIYGTAFDLLTDYRDDNIIINLELMIVLIERLNLW